MKQCSEILCVGDIQFETHITLDPALTQLLGKADIVFGNLETPISNKGHPVNKVITMRTDPAHLSELRKLNLKIVTLANNHILDFGVEPMFDTMRYLDEINIRYVGAGRNRKEASAPVMVESGSVKIGFLGAACTLPLDFAANDSKPGIAPIHVNTYLRMDPVIEQEQPGTPPFIYTEPDGDDLNYLVEVVKNTKQEVDYIIMGIHWGVPFQNRVLDYQAKIADVLTKNGVDFVVGHHPHTLHGLSAANNKVVFYSLGNFVFHYKAPVSLVKKFSRIMGNMQSSPFSTIAKLSISKSETAIELIPVVLNDEGNPRLATDKEAEQIRLTLQNLSADLGSGIEFEASDGIVIKVKVNSQT
ncbi:MAG: CapA family protein [Candidatus Caldarchaeum sp.]|nr:CapA family protein [Candidatus Caldarchaeum sp.]